MFSLDWPRSLGVPPSKAGFKLDADDFQVNEFFEDPFSGEGEHLVLRIEKRGLTTEDVVRSLARMTNTPSKLISYAGLKDRQAVTTQWFSIHSPGKEISGAETLQGSGWRVLESTRHCKKLKPGFLTENRFVIRLKDVTETDAFEQRIETIKSQGVPNYFGEQRFGRQGGNLLKAQEMLVDGLKIKDRFLKGLYCSAARSWLFNLILSKRVTDLSWNVPLPYDVMNLCGSNSIFNIDTVDETLLKRVQEKDISPASPLPGRRKANKEYLALIHDVFVEWQSWIDGLESLGLEEAWRPNILHVKEFEYTLNDTTARLSFSLPPGSYATTLLRELVCY